MVTMKPLFVGVDLGTTNSAAAVFDGDAVAMVRSQQGGALTPSVVRIDSRGSVMVGGRARRFLDSDPDNTRGEFKRLMGTAERLKFPAAGVERRPEELAAEVLKALRADVQEQLGVAVARASSIMAGTSMLFFTFLSIKLYPFPPCKGNEMPSFSVKIGDQAPAAMMSSSVSCLPFTV